MFIRTMIYSAVCGEQTSVKRIMTQSISDKYNWRTGTVSRSDGLPLRPSPLDRYFGKKHAYYALRDI